MDYSPQIHDHFIRPRRAGELLPGLQVGVARAHTPAASAEIQISARVEGGRITETRFLAHGCPATIAAGSWLCEQVQNRTVTEAEQLNAATIEQALSLAPVKRYCAVLAEDALRLALAKACGIQIPETCERP